MDEKEEGRGERVRWGVWYGMVPLLAGCKRNETPKRGDGGQSGDPVAVYSPKSG
jgi:hypothetical protein